MLPLISRESAVIGSHYQPSTRQTFYFDGTHWWKPVVETEQYMTQGMTGGAVALIIIVGLFFWPLWLFLIGSGPKMAVRAVDTGRYVWHCAGTSDQVRWAEIGRIAA